MFAVMYEVFLCLDMVHHKNGILLLALCLSNICVLAYSAIEYVTMHEVTLDIADSRDINRDPLVDLSRDLWKEIQIAEILVPIVLGLGTVLLWPIAYQLHREFSWTIYQCVQGSRKSRYQYLGYEVAPCLSMLFPPCKDADSCEQMYLILLKFDFYFLVGFILQYNLVDVFFEDPEYSLTMALIPLALLLMVLGTYFVRCEYRYPTILTAVSSRIQPSRTIPRLTHTDPPSRLCGLSSEPDHRSVRAYAPFLHSGQGVDGVLRQRGIGALRLPDRLHDLLCVEL